MIETDNNKYFINPIGKHKIVINLNHTLPFPIFLTLLTHFKLNEHAKTFSFNRMTSPYLYSISDIILLLFSKTTIIHIIVIKHQLKIIL